MLGAIHNCHHLNKVGVNGKTKLILCTFNILTQFFIISMASLLFKKAFDVYTLWGGGGSEKMYVLYTHLNIDNYTQFFSNSW